MNDSRWDYVGKDCETTTIFNFIPDRNVLEITAFSGVMYTEE